MWRHVVGPLRRLTRVARFRGPGLLRSSCQHSKQPSVPQARGMSTARQDRLLQSTRRWMTFKTFRRVTAFGMFAWVVSKGSWGFLDDFQFAQGSKEEFLARFFPREADGDVASRQREALKQSFSEPFWRSVTKYVREEVESRWSEGLTKLLPLGDITSGNRVQIYKDGDDYLTEVWDAIRAAKSRVWVEIFTIANDSVGNKTLKLLEEAAARGVEVIFIYDYIGSLHFDPGTKLQACPNACVAVYNPVFPLWLKVGPTLARDHRKVIIVDDVGFCGGRNLTAAYAGRRTGGDRQQQYQDISVKLEGPCVADLSQALLGTLYQIYPGVAAAKTRPQRRRLNGLPYSGPMAERNADVSESKPEPLNTGPLLEGEVQQNTPHSATGNGVLVQILRQNMRHELRSIDKAVRIILRDVTVDRAFVTTPYFMPTPKLRRDIIKASRNGADIRILTTGKPLTIEEDVVINFLQHRAHRHIYGKFLAEGVRIFEDSAALHSKTITVDQNLAVVGSFNFDAWSAHRNQEITAVMLDRDTARDLEEIFLDRCAQATEITMDGWQERTKMEVFLDWVCYHAVAFASLDSLCVYRQSEKLSPDEKANFFVRDAMDNAFDQNYNS